MKSFVDDKNYLLTKNIKNDFMLNVFNTAMSQICNGLIQIGQRFFKVYIFLKPMNTNYVFYFR